MQRAAANACVEAHRTQRLPRAEVPLTTDIEVMEVDVLIIGGGFAGTWAALGASSHASNVVLADKAYVSRSGA
jgi:heterodisulfide reductase subunit A-like polyferredoxin